MITLKDIVVRKISKDSLAQVKKYADKNVQFGGGPSSIRKDPAQRKWWFRYL